jgi:hypothetical protein
MAVLYVSLVSCEPYNVETCSKDCFHIKRVWHEIKPLSLIWYYPQIICCVDGYKYVIKILHTQQDAIYKVYNY